MNSLLEELECPICTDYLTIPIRQCTTGHSVCGKCITRLERCALCQSAFSESRNLTLEGLALKMKYPCINKGCQEILAYPDREKHELRCKFKDFQTSCAMKGCSFVGSKDSLKNHWLEKKTGAKIFQIQNSTSAKLKNDSYFVMLMEGFGELFWYKCKTFNNIMYFAVQFVGKSEKVDKYYFEIEIAKAGNPKKRILLSDYCKSLDLSENQLFKEDMCCTMGFGTLSHFLVNDYLNYSLRLCIVKERFDNKKKESREQKKNEGKPAQQKSGNQNKSNDKGHQNNKGQKPQQVKSNK